MESAVEKLRAAREFKTNKSASKSNKLTLFVGLYNAKDYLKTISNQLNEQEFSDFDLLIVDNDSTDATWSLIGNLDTQKFENVIILRNPINTGAHGSMSLNFDLIRTPWVTFMHQDDIYSPDHLSILWTALKDAKPDEIIFSTDMGAISASGKKIGSPPRSIWFQSGNDSITAFLTNLRTHTIPDSSSAYRSEVFGKVLPAWHNTAFPDTEMILKMCAYGRFIQIKRETVWYREHDNSISHSVTSREKDLGICVSLLSVFHSEEFQLICEQVQLNDRDNFHISLLKGISSRIQNNDFKLLLDTNLSEVLCEHWNYSCQNTLKHLAECYLQVDANFSSDFLLRLHKFQDQDSFEKVRQKDNSDYLRTNNGTTIHFTKTGVLRKLYVNYGYILPYGIRKALLVLIVRMRILCKGRDPWGIL